MTETNWPEAFRRTIPERVRHQISDKTVFSTAGSTPEAFCAAAKEALAWTKAQTEPLVQVRAAINIANVICGRKFGYMDPSVAKHYEAEAANVFFESAQKLPPHHQEMVYGTIVQENTLTVGTLLAWGVIVFYRRNPNVPLPSRLDLG